jgi:hypothetical protein
MAGKADSLENCLQKNLTVQERIKILHTLSKIYSVSDSKKALAKAEEAFDLSEQARSEYLANVSQRLIADALFRGGNYSEPESIYRKLVIAHSQNKEYADLGKVYNNLGVICAEKGNNENAIKYYFLALSCFDLSGDSAKRPSIYFNIGNNYNLRGDYKTAMRYYLRALETGKKLIKDKDWFANIYSSIGAMYGLQEEFGQAFYYYLESEKIYKESGNTRGLALVYGNMAVEYLNWDKTDEAKSYAQKSLQCYEKVFDADGVASVLFTYSSALSNQVRLQYKISRKDPFPAEAKEVLDSCLMFLDSVHNLSKRYGLKYHEKQVNFIKSDFYARRKEFADAWICMQRYRLLSDSLINVERETAIHKISTLYEVEKKENENTILHGANKIQALELKQNKYLLIGLGGLLVLFSLIVILVIRQNKLRHTQETMRLEQRLLRSQMNPHFIFNSLIAIESFIYKNEPKEAGKYLSGFARLMRLILENSREEYVSLEKEIKTLEHYLELQKLRYDEKFVFSIEVDENIDSSAIAIPPMLAQPFIENSIEHGLKNSSRKGEINVRFSLRNEQLFFEVEDNGIGFEKSLAMKDENKEHKSLATKITMERLKILNRRKNKKIKWLMEDVKDQVNNILGARITFTIPYTEV